MAGALTRLRLGTGDFLAERNVVPAAGSRFLPRMAGVTDRVEEHFRLFNEAVRSGEPSDTMTCVSDARDGDQDVVRFAWDEGGGGTLRVSWRDGAVAGLTIAFDTETPS